MSAAKRANGGASSSADRVKRDQPHKSPSDKYPMRYWEIIEGTSAAARKAQAVWRQTKKTHEALRRLRSKQADAQDAKAAARSLPTGPERSRRLQAADRRNADARRVYGNALSGANDRIARTMAKPTRR